MSLFPQYKISDDDCKSISEMDIEILSNGIVLFKNAIDVNEDRLLSWLDENVSPSNCGLEWREEGDEQWAEDWEGNRHPIQKLLEQPFRLGHEQEKMPVQDDTPADIKEFFFNCEKIIYHGLMRYIHLYPMILNTIWWKNRGHILRYTEGGQLGHHNDNDTNFRVVDGLRYPTSRPQAIYQVVANIIYLNDNFNGGEMNFPYANVTYKPVVGDMIYFPQNYTGTHGVASVTSGKRYVYLSNFGQGEDDIVQIHEPDDETANWVSHTYLPWVFQDYERYFNSSHSSSVPHGELNPVEQERPLEGEPTGVFTSYE